MKVKVTYNLNLDKVPGHVAYIYDGARQELAEIQEELGQIAAHIRAGQLPAEAAEAHVNAVRVKLESIDAILGDMVPILTGYESVLNTPPDELLKAQEAAAAQELAEMQEEGNDDAS